jgi:hypothetical protein
MQQERIKRGGNYPSSGMPSNPERLSSGKNINNGVSDRVQD